MFILNAIDISNHLPINTYVKVNVYAEIWQTVIPPNEKAQLLIGLLLVIKISVWHKQISLLIEKLS